MKKIFFERNEFFSRLAIKDEDELKEFQIELNDDLPKVGEIYIGTVKKIVPAIKCAFIDIGKEKNAYLYMKNKSDMKNIKNGDKVVVEIISEEIGDKGAKVTTNFTIAGKYCVIGKFGSKIRFSKQIQDKEFMNLIRNGIEVPSNIGITIRKNACTTSIKDINNEISHLYKVYEKIINDAQYVRSNKLLYKNDNFIKKIIDDIYANTNCEIIVNSKEDFSIIQKIGLNNEAKKNNFEVLLHTHVRNIMSYYGLEKEILSLTSNIISLKNGGTIVIDKTEAMNVIDVNSASNINNSSITDTAYTTNIEAAKEISKQIKLRNISGIIIIDFIDLNNKEKQNSILECLIDEFKNDRSTTKVYPFTELNLVQIVRKRRGKSIYEYLFEKVNNICMYGYKLNAKYLYFLIGNELKNTYNQSISKDIYVEINYIYKEDFLNNLNIITSILGDINNKIYFNFKDLNKYYEIKPLFFREIEGNNQEYKILSKNILYKQEKL